MFSPCGNCQDEACACDGNFCHNSGGTFKRDNCRHEEINTGANKDNCATGGDCNPCNSCGSVSESLCFRCEQAAFGIRWTDNYQLYSDGPPRGVCDGK